MKKIVLVLIAAIFLVSCLDNDKPKFNLEFLPIESFITPDTLTFGEIDTVSIKYILPNSCYSFFDLHYQVKDTSRIVAVRAAVELDIDCNEIATEKEFEFVVLASQREDYLFRFFKGFDANGESTFENVVVPVK